MPKKRKGNARQVRLIDANLNRCREGLRVIEDTARFVFNLRKVYIDIRTLRHELDMVTRRIYPELLQRRDSVHDAGRTIKEGGRSTLHAVIVANCRRAEESLRVLEEYSKLISKSAGATFKRIRYALYTIEKKLFLTLRNYDHN